MLAFLVLPAFPAQAAFVGPTTITIDGTFTDWGTPGAPTSGCYLQQDYGNSGQDDGAGFNGKQEDLNYVWAAASTQNGTSPASSSNPIQNFYYSIDTLSTSTFTGNKYNIQLNLGAASVGYADHLLQMWVDNGSSPKVKIVLLQYTTPYPAMRAFTTGSLTGVVSNVAAPYSGYTGAVDASATGAIGTYTYNSTTYYAWEINIPVGWFGSTYGGAVKNDGTGAISIIGAVFSSTGSYGGVGTVKDALNNSSNKTLITYTSATTGETSFVTTEISKLAFTTSAQSITAGAVSSLMTIQTQDALSMPENVTADTRVDLTSSSTNGKFYSDSGGVTQITYVTISSGTSSANFYYKDTTAGTPTITAAENPSAGYTDATQQETITGVPSIANSPSSFGFGVISEGSTNVTELTYFTLTNDGSVTVTVTIGGTDMTGGTTWTLSDTATPGADTCGLKAGLEGGSYNIIVKKNASYNTLVASLAAGASQKWGLQLSAPTSFSDGGAKSGTITLTATQS